MIEVPRALARAFKTVLRRSLMAHDTRGCWPTVLCRSDHTGLTLQARKGDVAVRYHQQGTFPSDAIAFNGSLLAQLEGRDPSPVVLESLAAAKGRAQWASRSGPQTVEFETVVAQDVPAFPALPKQMRRQLPEFLEALAAAAAITARESVRYSLSRLQLRGRDGQVVATDGKQLLVWGGFTFPWADDVLIPALPVFATLIGEGEAEIGRTNSDVALCVGPWTLLLAVDATGRFPNAAAVVPRSNTIRSRLRLGPKDVAALIAALPRMPGLEDDHEPVSLHLESPPVVRAWDNGAGPGAEMVLAESSTSGVRIHLRTDRQYLRRALQLGFTEIQVADANKPVSCRDATRCYVWVPLSAKDTSPATSEALPTAAPPPSNPTERETDPMPPTRPHGDLPPDHDNPAEASSRVGLAEVITETEGLRDLLHDAFVRTSRLLAALKQQRRQAKAVQQAVQSLRQLQLDR